MSRAQKEHIQLDENKDLRQKSGPISLSLAKVKALTAFVSSVSIPRAPDNP